MQATIMQVGAEEWNAYRFFLWERQADLC